MQFQINITCTPEEARQFFGVPDMVPMQQALMEQINVKLSEGIKTMEPEALMQTWAPAMFQGWSDMQQNFWKQMSSMGNVNINTDGETAATAQEQPEPAETSPAATSKTRRK